MPRIAAFLRDVLPGVLLCAAISAAAIALDRLELHIFGRAWIEALVIAILLGAVVRTAWSPGARWLPGIRFSAKTLLEIAVVLLGASISAQTLAGAGWELLVGIALVVAVAIGLSYALGRALGLSRNLALLVACGNSICGNSAIAAVAPVIGAEGKDVAASIAFTAVLGVAVVLGLPLLAAPLNLSELQYGVLAGLTVYAVPQVLAAAAPIGLVAVQMGALVKLVRVLMLGPVVLVLSLLSPHTQPTHAQRSWFTSVQRMVPWFIIAFLALMTLRSAGLIPEAALAPTATLTTLLTIIAMAALGLGVDIRAVARAGTSVTITVCLSLIALGLTALGLIRLLAIG